MKLISYLTLNGDDSEENKRPLLKELFSDPDFCAWIQAYSMIPDIERLIYRTLLDLETEQSFPENETFNRKIRDGFLLAAELGSEEMLRKLVTVTSGQSKTLQERVNRYLPEGTPLSVSVVFTIDGYNTGMMRENLVYYSILRVDPVTYDPLKLAHEVHHVGVYQWFNQDPKWSKWFGMEGTPEKVAAELLRYVVSEGIANHLMSPKAVSLIEWSGELTRLHNERVQYLDNRYFKYLRMMQDTIFHAYNGELEKSRKLYRELSIDEIGSGVPAGHYASARMFKEILGARDESIINEIIENPWSFFEIYNRLNSKSIHFSDDFLSIF